MRRTLGAVADQQNPWPELMVIFDINFLGMFMSQSSHGAQQGMFKLSHGAQWLPPATTPFLQSNSELLSLEGLT